MRIFEAAPIINSISIDVVSVLVYDLREKSSDRKHANRKSGSSVLAIQEIIFLRNMYSQYSWKEGNS